MGKSPDMTMAAGIEREYKFDVDVDADFDPPDLRPAVGRTVRLAEVGQRSTYFDTADHRLWARGITFRHRIVVSGDAPDQSGGTWTLKLPEDPLPTGEGSDGAVESSRAELSWRGPIDAVPEAASRIIAGIVRRARLATVAELSALRRRLLLQAPDADGPWGEIDDDVVSVTAGPNAGQRFRQIELELLPGAAAPAGQLDAVIGLLRSAGASPGGGSKLGTALGLPSAPSGPARKGPRPGQAVTADVLEQVISDDLAAVLDCDYRLRRDAGDSSAPDAELVRRARVAARRARADVRTFEPVLDPVWCRHVRRELRAFGQALGRIRDADVLLARLRAHDEPDDREGVDELVRLLVADRALAAADLDGYMRSTAYIDLLDRLNAAVSAPPLLGRDGERPGRAPARSQVRRLVARRWRKLVAELDRLPSQPAVDELHRVEVRAKRLRCAAEAAAPSVGKRARRTGRAAKQLQDLLGEISDAASAVSWLRQLASHPSLASADAFVAGRLAGRAEASVRALRAELPAAARGITSKRVSSWLK